MPLSQWIDLVCGENQMKLFFFIVLCELLMPCQLFAQKCSNCQEITKISKCLWPPPPPEHYAIGNIHGIFCYWVLLHYNMSFKTIAGGFNGAFWWYGPLSEDREKCQQIYQNYLVALNIKWSNLLHANYCKHWLYQASIVQYFYSHQDVHRCLWHVSWKINFITFFQKSGELL